MANSTQGTSFTNGSILASSSNSVTLNSSYTSPYLYEFEGIEVRGKLSPESSIEIHGIDIIKEFFIMRDILMSNPEFKEQYEKERLVRKLRGEDP